MPSEAWIHILFINSKYREKSVAELQRCYTGTMPISSITYFEYTRSIKILDEGDIDKIIASKRLFARKVIVGCSDRPLSVLDELENTTI